MTESHGAKSVGSYMSLCFPLLMRQPEEDQTRDRKET